MESQKLHFAQALLPEGWARDVTVAIGADGMIQSVTPGGRGGRKIKGAAVPAMPNVHSHAHQRLMQGLAEKAGPGADSFWTWREVMYGFALRLGPDDLEAVAAQLYVEMLKSGFSVVGEFQYLHHQPDGTPYDEPAELSLRCLSAAEQAGIAITLLPTLYAYGGFGGQPPVDGQRRFIHGADSYLRMQETLAKASAINPLRRLGISPHSLRATTPALLKEVLNGIAPDAPVHIHVAEQVKEVEDCVSFSGLRPVEMLLENFDLSPRWTAIHATHMTARETQRLASSGAIAGLCPTTEANLGDGVFPATHYMKDGGAIAIGSDSHITVSPSEDLRMLEYSQRLRDRTRNALALSPGASTGRTLYEAALKGGAKSMAQPVGAIAEGHRADIAVLDTEHPSLIGRSDDQLLDSWIFSAGNAAVAHMFVAGAQLVKNGRHIREEKIETRFRNTVRRLMT